MRGALPCADGEPYVWLSFALADVDSERIPMARRLTRLLVILAVADHPHGLRSAGFHRPARGAARAMKKRAVICQGAFGGRSTMGLVAGLILFAGLLALPEAGHARTRVLFGNHSEIVSVPPGGGKPHTIYEARRGDVENVTASRSGRTLSFVLRQRRLSDGIRTFMDQIWVMRGDGSGAHRIRQFVRRFRGNQLLTPNDGRGSPYAVSSLDISDGGNRLVVERNGFVHTFDANGRSFRWVTFDGYLGFEPQFDPGGRRLVMQVVSRNSSPGPPIAGIGIAGVAGGPVRLLHGGRTGTLSSDTYTPTFSDDGRFIAFSGRVPKKGLGIWIMRRDGSDPRLLRAASQPRSYLTDPDFSPNGRSLVLLRQDPRDGDVDYSICTVRRDGTRLRELLAPSGFTFPVWSR
jgi:hypothetical protein